MKKRRFVEMSGQYQRIYEVVKKIPKGENVPWQRVITAQGEVSKRAEAYFQQKQGKPVC